MHFTQFPEEVQELQAELMNGQHEKLLAHLNKKLITNLDDAILEIATHCQHLLEGYYSYSERVALCRILAKKLKSRREDNSRSVILDVSGHPLDP